MNPDQTNPMFLTKDRVVQILKGAPSGTTPVGIIAGLREKGYTLEGYDQAGQPAQPPEQPGFFQRLFGDFAKRGQDITQAVEQPGINIAQGNVPAGKVAQSFGEAGLRTVGAVAGGAVDIVGEATKSILSPILDLIPKNPNAQQEFLSAKNITGQTNQETLSSIQDFAKKHPEAVKDFSSVVNIASLFGLKAVPGAETPVSEVPGAIKQAGTSLYEKMLTRSAQKATETAIDAVSPELTGKNLVRAYRQQAISGKPIGTSGLMGTQELADSKATIQLGQDLSDVLTSSNPTKNLNSLGEDFQKTESKLSGLLKADKTPIVKQGVNDSLDELGKSMPREFKGIKDSEKAFNDVVDFAKSKVNSAQPNINGLRDARIAFDQQAKIEYPNAFKNGTIDLKTPAGKAIKATRDAMNDYLYNTAEKGSDLQKLIKRESDIYKAVDNIAPKSAKLEGKNWLQKFTTKYPTASKALGFIGAEKVLKGLGVPHLP